MCKSYIQCHVEIIDGALLESSELVSRGDLKVKEHTFASK